MSSLDDDLSWWVFRDRRHQRMPWIEMKTFSVDFFFFVFGPLVKVDRGKCLSLLLYSFELHPRPLRVWLMMNHDPLALSTPVKNVPKKSFEGGRTKKCNSHVRRSIIL